MLPVSIGLDGVHCTVVLKKQAINAHPIDRNLKNADGTIYGNIKSKGEHIKLTFNLPLMIRDDNLQPFGKTDKKHITYIKRKITSDLKKIYGDDIKCIVPNAIEVNATKKLRNANVSDVLKLLRLSYLKEHEQLVVWMNKGINACDEKTTGMLTQTIVNEYRIKAYDKSEQMNYNNNELRCEKNVMRFELIFQGRRIRQAYGRNCTMFDILDNINCLTELFKYKFHNEVIERVRHYLTDAKNIMFEELTEGNRPKTVFSKYRNAIVDSKQIQKALERYYMFTGQQDKSKTLEKVLARSLGIESEVIKEFNDLLKG